MRLVGALRAAGYDVSIPDVFEQRTIAAMAANLPGGSTGESLITAVEPFALIGEDDRTALPADVVDAYPLSQIQTGMLVEMLAEQGGNTYRNINSFRIPDELSFFGRGVREPSPRSRPGTTSCAPRCTWTATASPSSWSTPPPRSRSRSTTCAA